MYTFLSLISVIYSAIIDFQIFNLFITYIREMYYLVNYQRRKNALKKLKEINSNRQNYYIIHYTCDDFKRGDTITSIAIKHLNDGETTSFSLEKTAANKNIEIHEIKENLPFIEQHMLKEFFHFIKERPEKYWIHWNMNDDNFGFRALENRALNLSIKDEIFSIIDDRKINLSSLLVDLYGYEYIDHPRLKNLMKLNNINPPDFYPGYSTNPKTITEPILFHEGKYKEIRLSCLRKVYIFNKFVDLAIDKQLKTKTNLWKVFGTNFSGIYNIYNEQPWSQLVSFFLGMIVNNFFDKFFDKFLNWILSMFF